MTAEETIRCGFMVTITPWADDLDHYDISYVPRGPQQVRGAGGASKRAPEYTADVAAIGSSVKIDWRKRPPGDGEWLAEIDRDIERRIRLLHKWLASLRHLIGQVRKYASELDWATKQIEKPMEDSEIGTYRAPALLMQHETAKVLLEPVGRTAPGTEGVVDLYLMPGYDDIASFYHYSNRWNLHYLAPGQKSVGDIRQAESKPLTKPSLRAVLEELRKNAG
jgi:hypothetical protein